MSPERKYPVGIQTFERLRKENYVYIDKTDLVWKMTKESPYVFLSRPRRFGKSLLTTTLDSYFKGQKELFEGLKIMELETEWEQYPVIHLDVSCAAHRETSIELQNALSHLLSPMANTCGIKTGNLSPGFLLFDIIRQTYIQTGKQVVLLIDEYDAPLLDVHGNESLHQSYLQVMLEFFHTLKGSEEMLRFCFITGVTAFPEPATLASFINLTDISLNPKYATICGITKKELHEKMDKEVESLAKTHSCPKDKMYQRLKLQYGGYHYAAHSPEIYNPHCLMDVFTSKMFQFCWFSSFHPSLIHQQLNRFRTNMNELDYSFFCNTDFYKYTEHKDSVATLLFQGGYLTIKDYDKETNSYVLSVPNSEVYTDLLYGQLPLTIGLNPNRVENGFALRFWRALKKDDLNTAMQELTAFLAGIPYVEGFKEKLNDVKNYEGFYEYTFWLIFNMLNVYARTQVKCAKGRIDFVVQMPDTTYVFELKVNGTAQQALDQINDKGYFLPYQTEGHKVVKVGVAFDRDTMTVGEYLVG